MRKVSVLLILLASFVLLATVVSAADDNPMSSITVKSSETNSGVITLQIAKEAKSFELTCNEGSPNCTDLKKGSYKMVELPKNHGMYDCRNVDVYAETATGGEDDQKLGQYCLINK